MVGKKLTEADRETIVDLYRNTNETAVSIAQRFGVGNTTIGRLLKERLPENEYEELVAQKRAYKGRKDDTPPPPTTPLIPAFTFTPPAEVVAAAEEERAAVNLARELENEDDDAFESVKRRSPLPVEDLATTEDTPDLEVSPKTPDNFRQPATAVSMGNFPVTVDEDDDGDNEESPTGGGTIFGEEYDDDDGDDAEEDGEEEIDTSIYADDADIYVSPADISSDLEILPLSAAHLPRSCYIAIDRNYDPIVKPLREFAHLGDFPERERQSNTLPIFDSQQVAKRFISHRSQRVIKVPDTYVFVRTSRHLRAKGISLLLVRGRIYAID